MNPICVVEQYGTIRTITIDGSLRTFICIEYLENKFALSKDVTDVAITVN